MRLFFIGDGLTRRVPVFYLRTHGCLSTLMSKLLGTDPYGIFSDRVYLGYPLNLEELMRSLERKFGSDIFGPIERLQAVSTTLKYKKRIERYCERSKGKLSAQPIRAVRSMSRTSRP